MKKILFSFAAVLAAVAAPLGAQWTSFGTVNNDGSEYWDNRSADGEFCNAGFVLTHVATTASCGSQRPSGWLPYTGTIPDQYFNSTFVIGAGAFSFTAFGDIAGADQGWGFWDGNHATTTDMGSAFVSNHVFAGYWGLWVDMTDGTRAFSDTNWQFAAFGFTGDLSSFVFGFEDICVSGNDAAGLPCQSDRDYNDTFLAISGVGRPQEVVPEPATMTLLATGLAGMAAASRRRRNKK